MRQPDAREKSPRVRILASGCPVIPVRGDDFRKTVLGHPLPIEGDAGIDHFSWRWREFIEEKPGHHAKVAAAGAAAGPKQIGVFTLIDSAKFYFPLRVHCQY